MRIATTFLLVFLYSCGEKVEEEASAVDNSEPQQETESLDQKQGTWLSSGLPDSCEEKNIEEEKSCYVCQIKGESIDRCIDEGSDYDFAENCEYDSDKLECRLKGKRSHYLSLQKPIEIEILNMVPLAIAGGKIFVSLKISDEKKEKAILNSALDLVSKNLRSFVLGQNRESVIESTRVFAKEQYATLGDDENPKVLSVEKESEVQKATETVFDFFQTKRRSGSVTLLDGISLAKELASVVPSLKESQIFKNFNFQTFDIASILAPFLNPQKDDESGEEEQGSDDNAEE